MYIFAEPMTEEQVAEVQNLNAAAVEDFERKLTGHSPEDDKSWEDIEASVQDTMTQDELGLTEDADKQAIEPTKDELYADAGQVTEKPVPTSDSAVTDTGTAQQPSKDGEVLDDQASSAAQEPNSPENPSLEETATSRQTQEGPESNVETASSASSDIQSHDSNTKPGQKDPSKSDDTISLSRSEGGTGEPKEFAVGADMPFIEEINEQTDAEAPKKILAMTLTLRNKVNGTFVLRPAALKNTDKWNVEYALVEVTDDSRAWALYQACIKRREKKLTSLPEEDAENVSFYVQKLRNLSNEGRKWRQQVDDDDKLKPVRVLGREE